MLAHFLHVSCHSKAEESPDRDLLKNRSWAPIWTAGKSTTDSWGWIKRGWNNKKIKHVISTIIVIVSSLSVMVLYQTQIILYNSRQHYTRDQTGTLPKTNSSPLKVGLLLPPKRTCPSSNHWVPGGPWNVSSPIPPSPKNLDRQQGKEEENARALDSEKIKRHEENETIILKTGCLHVYPIGSMWLVYSPTFGWFLW